MDLLHFTARMSVQWMLYCLAEGSGLALFAWLLLRLLPRQNAGTRFALWFSILSATVVLPFFAGQFHRTSSLLSSATFANSHSLLILRDSFAAAIFVIWAAVAAVGILRVGAGLWQVRQIRKDSEEISPETLGIEIRKLQEGFRRRVSLRLSDRVPAPAAIGFFRPAVVIPRWFLKEISPAEMEQVVLHELTHLQRRDDWTNLAQKIMKGILFFHPVVWWMEQRISLEREMACDEAVLAASGCPQRYAQCLTRLAEKSMARKRMALAQGLLSRMQQLSLRVAQILDVNRPGATRIWKPAMPMVAAAAAVCAFSAWSAPALVSFQSETIAPSASFMQPAAPNANSLAANANQAQPKTVQANFSLGSSQSHPRPRRRTVVAKSAPPKLPQAAPTGDYVVHSELIVTVARDPETGVARMWQVSMVQFRTPVATPAVDQTVHKTASRKNI